MSECTVPAVCDSSDRKLFTRCKTSSVKNVAAAVPRADSGLSAKIRRRGRGDCQRARRLDTTICCCNALARFYFLFARARREIVYEWTSVFVLRLVYAIWFYLFFYRVPTYRRPPPDFDRWRVKSRHAKASKKWLPRQIYARYAGYIVYSVLRRLLWSVAALYLSSSTCPPRPHCCDERPTTVWVTRVCLWYFGEKWKLAITATVVIPSYCVFGRTVARLLSTHYI